ncbi:MULTISPECIES: DUF4352 domain-containing protein [Lacticaseibacillus]|uniref:DUF4352 domain-containing protein n=2 Tax=Lacticaseibacillus TaxID=2759736 RepID=A0AAN1C7L6_LACCA|nr:MULTISPECIES: DUF4352 domain-containing protein [Lacticaseibacillus]ARY91251.1 hypothetical protein BGL52_05640 [Lacticaseibacillus casei]KAB1968433.1 DUF4352 domain-containing protein [Lacticaseibacillus casei]WLV81869.1 DUF4352 domain-containing protein [Lacticaseibacillus sp. NCIMB 15473]WNX25775.1 DUF4352 domain-containing protein [Lacticaseibacillus casei]WNX28548.1 DUF4352 domain-containing protein [Lacticaseibacillus casei]
MKKTIIIGCSILATLVLSGCGNTTGTSSGKNGSEVASLKAENKSLKKQLAADNSTTSKKRVLSPVGEIQYTITNITTKRVENERSNYTNAEYNFSGIKDFPSRYYRTEISYQLKNIGAKAFSLSNTSSKVLDDDGIEYTRDSTTNFGIDMNSNGKVQPGTATTGTFYLLTKTKPNVKNISINVGDQFNGIDSVGKGGIAK